jgi:phosphoenolpyruvate carboxykinase (GTP)
MTDETPAHLIDWTGKDWTPGCGRPAAHPNARFTAPASQCPTFDPEWDNPEGVSIEALIFGGRMSKNVPLVFQAFDWSHGVYLAATMGSEATAAAEKGLPPMRRDPMAMLPFCGYNMADYWDHWLNLGRHLANPPGIFRVNWFRRDDDGNFLWPGFGENMRVLKWVVDRVRGQSDAVESPIGHMPRHGDIQWEGLDFDPEIFYRIMAVNREQTAKEARSHEELFDKFLDRLPKELIYHRELLKYRVWRSPEVWELTRTTV